MAKDNLKALASARYKESGLTDKDAKLLGYKPLSAKSVIGLKGKFKSLMALQIPYPDPLNPKKCLSGWPGWPPFYRLRYLEVEQGFDQLTKGKPRRYAQAPNTGVCAYFPSNIDWAPILNNPEEPIIITEGEFKAAKSCKEGYATIGLGGVYSFRSSNLGLTFLEELKAVNWVGRYVYIIYDSDSRTNEQVCHALNALAKELMKRGAIPLVVNLPSILDDGKTGLDDFLVHRPSEALGELLRTESQPLTLASKLWCLNKEVLYVHDPGLILATETGQKLSPGAFKEHAYSTVEYAEQVLKGDGSVSLKPVPAASAWLTWPLRREVGSLTYAPGESTIIEALTIRGTKYNIWPGWGVEPKKGDVTPFLTLLKHLFTNTDPEDLTWFLKWCAYPLQFPGTKLFTATVIYGTKHGTGKSLIGYTLGRIYGPNFTEISQGDLHTSFNEWSEGKQFVMGDDVTGSNCRQDADKLKKLITQLELRVNMKYVPSYVIPDRINYLFTSNHPDAFFLEDDDRRYFVHEVTVLPLSERFYTSYGAWLAKGGAQAVFDYLLHLNLKGFNPAAPALKTSAKERMIADVKSDLGAWVQRLIANPDELLVVGKVQLRSDMYTNRELLMLYDPASSTRCTANGLGRELKRAGVLQAYQGRPIPGPSGSDRYYILRNTKKWSKAVVGDLKAHLGKSYKPEKKKTKKPKY